MAQRQDPLPEREARRIESMAARTLEACGRTVGEPAEWRRTPTKFSAHQAIAAGLAHETA